MKLGVILVSIAALALAACPPPGPGPSPTPGPDADAAGPPVIDAGLDLDAAPADDCAAAEMAIARLDCKGSRGQSLTRNKHDVPFAQTCRDAARAGVDVHPACIAHAKSCSEVFTCAL